jgi:hypothetical protein
MKNRPKRSFSFPRTLEWTLHEPFEPLVEQENFVRSRLRSNSGAGIQSSDQDRSAQRFSPRVDVRESNLCKVVAADDLAVLSD